MSGAFALATIGLTPAAQAQDAVLAEMYGSGVHAYFSNDVNRAYDELSRAIAGGSKDPRAYYFRALALNKMGRESEATADMHEGSRLEAADVNQFYPVARSLERVQGGSRVSLERYRSLARAEAHQKAEKKNQARYEQRRRAEADVLRAPATAPKAAGPADALPARPVPAAAPTPPPADDNPFGEDAADSAPAPAMPAAKAPAAEAGDDNPFGGGDADAMEEEAPAKAPAGDDAMPEEEDGAAAPPAAKTPAKAAATTIATEDDAESADDAMSADEPVAKVAPAAKAPAKAPAAKAAPKEDADNPFGIGDDDAVPMADEMAAPAAKKPAAAMPKDAMADDEMADEMPVSGVPAKPAAKAAPKAPAGKTAPKAMEDDAANPFMDDAEMPAKPAAKGKAPAKAMMEDE